MAYIVISPTEQNTVQVSTASVPEVSVQIPSIQEVYVQAYALPSDIAQGPPGNDVPDGGEQYQVIVKQSATPQDVNWEYPDKIIFPVRNEESFALDAGDAVYAVGEVGSSGRIRVRRCDPSDSSKMPAIGIALNSVGAGSDGLIVAQGIMPTNFSITGETSWVDGQNAYVGSGGKLTSTKPTGTDLIQNVGTILKTNGTNIQEFKVSSIDRTNDVPNLPQGKIFIGSSANTVASPYTIPTSVGGAGQVLQSDGTNIVFGDAAAGVTNLATTQTSGNEVVITSDTGTDATIAAATTTVAGVMTAADKTKLDGLDTAAEQNVQSDWGMTDPSDDSYIIGKPTIPTQLTDLSDVNLTTPSSGDILVRNSSGEFVNAAIIEGSGITITDNDGSITISSTGGGGGTFDQDYVLNIPDENGVQKTFGKYLNGDTIPSNGLTANEVLIDAWTDAVEPTPTFTFTATPDWNHPATAGVNLVGISIPNSGIINNFGATGTSVLEYQLGTSSATPTGAWTNTNLGPSLSYGGSGNTTVSYDVGAIAYSTSNYFHFRLRVTDSTTGTSEQTFNSYCQAQSFDNPEHRFISGSTNLQRLSTLPQATGGSNLIREIGDYKTKLKWEVRRDEAYGPLDTSGVGLLWQGQQKLFTTPSANVLVSAAPLNSWYSNAAMDIDITTDQVTIEGGINVDMINIYDNSGNAFPDLIFCIKTETNVTPAPNTSTGTYTVKLVPSYVICFDTTALTAASTDAEIQAVLDAFGTDDDGVNVRKVHNNTTSSSYPAIIGNTPTFRVQTNGEYLYLFYPGNTDVSNFLLNGVEGVNGAFTKIGNRNLTNRYGYTQTYTIYRSNAPNAFNNDYLNIS